MNHNNTSICHDISIQLWIDQMNLSLFDCSFISLYIDNRFDMKQMFGSISPAKYRQSIISSCDNIANKISSTYSLLHAYTYSYYEHYCSIMNYILVYEYWKTELFIHDLFILNKLHVTCSWLVYDFCASVKLFIQYWKLTLINNNVLYFAWRDYAGDILLVIFLPWILFDTPSIWCTINNLSVLYNVPRRLT